MAKLDPTLVESGPCGEVRYARRESGAYEARDFLENAPLSTQAKFDHLFRRMVSHGKINNQEKFRKLRDAIWEFKARGDRILCFQHGACWYLTHHYAKSGQRCPAKEIEHAKTIRGEQLSEKRG